MQIFCKQYTHKKNIGTQLRKFFVKDVAKLRSFFLTESNKKLISLFRYLKQFFKRSCKIVQIKLRIFLHKLKQGGGIICETT